MVTIEWCRKKRGGIELVSPSNSLADAYIKKAEGSLRASVSLDDNIDWKISSMYYAMYFAVYSLLMKIGIKCEIHSCTIGVAESLLSEYFSRDDIRLLRRSMKARIDAQYYTDRNVSESTFKDMVEESPAILAKCKDSLNRITEREIREIRDRLEKI